MAHQKDVDIEIRACQIWKRQNGNRPISARSDL